jgi:hypothetical protein
MAWPPADASETGRGTLVKTASLTTASFGFCRTAYLSFGGLLMALRGSYRHLQELVIGENVYLLIKH